VRAISGQICEMCSGINCRTGDIFCVLLVSVERLVQCSSGAARCDVRTELDNLLSGVWKRQTSVSVLPHVAMWFVNAHAVSGEDPVFVG
jgi:hypothetical protein